MIHGNGTEFKTKICTFQTKYHLNGGKIGSYSCKLSDLKPKKAFVPRMTANELVLAVLRANRNTLNLLEFRTNAVFHRYKRETDKAIKAYMV